MSSVVFQLPAYMDGQRILVGFAYNTRMPWTCRLTLPLQPVVARFVFRELLRDGQDGPRGTRDLRVAPSADSVEVRFVERTRTGLHVITVHFEKSWFGQAMECVFRMVPKGQEVDRMDWDNGVRALGGVA